MRFWPGWTRALIPLVLADLRHRYAGSVLGSLWAVIGPFLEVGVYAAAFGLLVRPGTAREGLAFALYVASGLLPWAGLRDALEASTVALTENRWLRRSLVPVDLLVARQTVTSSLRAAAGLLIVLLLMGVSGRILGPIGLALVVLGLVLQTLCAYGLGLALAPLATLYPDLRPGLTSVLTLLTFASPILYPESLARGTFAFALEWNPFTHFLRFYRGALVAHAPTPLDWAVVLGTPVVLLLLGSRVKGWLLWQARDRL